jgi:hypothetical protein
MSLTHCHPARHCLCKELQIGQQLAGFQPLLRLQLQQCLQRLQAARVACCKLLNQRLYSANAAAASPDVCSLQLHNTQVVISSVISHDGVDDYLGVVELVAADLRAGSSSMSAVQQLIQELAASHPC